MGKKLVLRRNPHAEFSQYNRGREVGWRYNRIGFLLRHNRLPQPGIDDRQVLIGYQFLRRWHQIQRKAKRERWLPEDLAMHLRHRLYVEYTGPFLAYYEFLNNNAAQRLQMEAWILTGEDLDKIGEHLGIPTECVEWYEALFFNVRDRLHLVYYITEQVLEISLNRGLSNFEIDTVAKYFGYHGGAVVLRSILTSYDSAISSPGSGEACDHYFMQFMGNRLSAKMSSLINAWEGNQWNMEKGLELMLRLKELAIKADSASSTVDRFTEITQTMLDGISWGIGIRAADQVLGGKTNTLRSYFGHVGEPRVQELIAAATGQPTIQPADLQKPLPPPRRAENDEETEQGS